MADTSLVESLDKLLDLLPQDEEIENAFAEVAKATIYQLTKQDPETETYYMVDSKNQVIQTIMHSVFMSHGLRTALEVAAKESKKWKQAITVRHWEHDIPVRRVR